MQFAPTVIREFVKKETTLTGRQDVDFGKKPLAFIIISILSNIEFA